jgi:pyrimidine-nucleoside phosphorylase
MRAVDLILKKREAGSLSREEIDFLIQGYVAGSIPDYQLSALAMAVFFRGMSFEETGHLTRAMIASGELLDFSRVSGPLVDKHSTGGVGDKVSLILAPLAAACGCKVPMMSGRSLGHTGGTLDKLESIPGYSTDLPVPKLEKILGDVGYFMTGQSDKVVPADRLLYALRDVTGTVESVPLITASIMSKKFAEGAQGIVFDVKTGSGAFMKSETQAEELAVSLVETGKSLDRRVFAVISDMDQPLGRKIGNFLEVEEVIDCLQMRGPRDLVDLTLRLTGWMLVLGGLAPDIEAAETLCREKLADGSAWKKFVANVERQGGDSGCVLEPARGPRAAHILSLRSESSGFVERVDAYLAGRAAGLLGASRAAKSDKVLPEVGIELRKTRGEAVKSGDELCLIYAADSPRAGEARALMRRAYTLGAEQPKVHPRVRKEITGK